MTAYEQADQAAFVETIGEGFRRAVERAGRVDRTVVIGGLRVRLRFAGTAIVDPVFRAFAHLEVDDAGAPDLTVHVFDAATTGAPLPYLAASYLELLRLHWWDHLEGRRAIAPLTGPRVRTAYHPGPGILTVLDRERSEAFSWIDDAARLPHYERAYPLTMLVNWWLADRGRHVVHAACFGTDDGCVLLPGRGGSGKSTTTVSAVHAGLHVVGDDYVVVELGDGEHNPSAHSLYNAVKLKLRSDVDRFPGFAARVDNLDRVFDDEIDADAGGTAERAVTFLVDHFPDQLLRSAPIRAILVPRLAGEPATTITPTSATAAFKALAPSTVFQLAGNGKEAFRALAAIARRVPAYEIALGSDLPGVPAAIRAFLEHGPGAAAPAGRAGRAPVVP